MADITKVVNSDVQIFRVSICWKIGITILAYFGFIFSMLGICVKSGGGGHSYLYVFGFLGLMLFSLYKLLSVFSYRVEIYPNKVRRIGLFNNKELSISEINGFRINMIKGEQTLFLVPKDIATKGIKIGHTFERQEDLLEWCNRNLSNLDVLDLQQERETVLQDTSLGETAAQRQYVFDRAKMWSKIINVLTFGVCFWAFVYPEPYTYIIWALIIMPLAALVFVRYFEGVLELSTKRNNARPNIQTAFLGPGIVLSLRGYQDFNILNWDNFWLPFALCYLLICLLMFFLAKDIRQRAAMIIIFHILFCSLYGYGTVLSLNGILDKSIPSLYKAQIIEKHVSSGTRNFYFLKLSPWGPRTKEEKITVEKSVYDRSKVGNKIDVAVRNGSLGIPWFYIL
ncbi:MAG: hypothetical protein A4E66_02305 [Syntrophus sp. PtaB.Bin001]|nr:MAG: hypothetical protein A4E66_02305 [Syntrophus sp. PtaB.Bin001]